MNKIFFLKFKKEKGLSVLGVMVSILILSIGIIGVLNLMNQSVKALQYKKDRLTATFLAQEGIELVRNMRDTNWVNAAVPGSPPWTNLPDPNPLNNRRKDYKTLAALPTSNGCNDIMNPAHILKINSTEGYLYNPVNAFTQSKFRRCININSEVDGGRSVEVIVRWPLVNIGYKQVVMRAIIYDWH